MRLIERGDIIVFKFPEELERDFIKRVIGLPGDTLRKLKNQTVFINVQALTEPYAHYLFPPGREGRPTRSICARRRPAGGVAGHYFMMGDNRDDSQDSRFWGSRRRLTSRAGRCSSTGRSTRPRTAPWRICAWEQAIHQIH